MTTTEPGHDFPAACARIRAWLFDAALPLWAARGRDAVHGGFVEQLRPDGAPDLEAIRRLRVQARQIFVFAIAADLGWSGPARQIVAEGLDYLIAHGRSRAGGWAHLLTPQGGVLDGSRDTYDQAFMLLALAHAYRATGREDALLHARQTLEFMDAELADKSGDGPDAGPGARPWRGYVEGAPPARPRRQNPHMHFLEAMLALYDATGEADYLHRSARVVDLFRRRFFDAESGLVYEFFADDWSRLETQDARMIEPGHLYEWVWLLRQYEKKAGADMGDAMAALFASAEAFRVGSFGFALDGVRDDGRMARATRRLWPQTEALRACLAMKESGRLDTDQRAAELVAGLFADYLNVAPRGAWIDRFDDQGRAISDDIPASSFYHIIGAFAEFLRVHDGPKTASG